MSEPDLQLRDERLNGAIDNTGWPLVRQVQTCARGGSVTLMSQNVFHRRNRRRVRQTLHHLFSLIVANLSVAFGKVGCLPSMVKQWDYCCIVFSGRHSRDRR